MLSYDRVLVAVFFLLSLAVSARVALEPDRGLLDFGAFYMAGVAQNAGVDDPSGVYPQLAAETGAHFGHTDGRGHSPNLNPPISLYPFRLIADTEPGDVKTGLNVFSALVFVAFAVAMLRAYPQHRNIPGVLWIAAFGGFWYTLWLGQLYLLLFALGLGAWFLVDRGTHPLLAGLLIGLLVADKHFALWPLFLLLAGHPRIALPGSRSRPQHRARHCGRRRHESRPAQRHKGQLLGHRLALLASPIAWIGYGLLLMPVLLSRRWQAIEWAAAISLTGLWFAFGRGEPFLLASLLLLVLLAKDLMVRRQLMNAVEQASEQQVRQTRIAA